MLTRGLSGWMLRGCFFLVGGHLELWDSFRIRNDNYKEWVGEEEFGPWGSLDFSTP